MWSMWKKSGFKSVAFLLLLIIQLFFSQVKINIERTTVLPAKSDSDVMFCLQSYQGLKINRSFVY